jgi:hypothetical protein
MLTSLLSSNTVTHCYLHTRKPFHVQICKQIRVILTYIALTHVLRFPCKQPFVMHLSEFNDITCE